MTAVLIFSLKSSVSTAKIEHVRKPLLALDCWTSPITALKWSPTLLSVFIVTSSSTLSLFSLSQNVESAIFTVEVGEFIHSASWGVDGKRLAVGGKNIHVYDCIMTQDTGMSRVLHELEQRDVDR